TGDGMTGTNPEPHVAIRRSPARPAAVCMAGETVSYRIRPFRVALRFGDTAMTIADEFPEFDVLGPKSLASQVALHLATDDVDALWKSAVAMGATSKGEPADMFTDARPVSTRRVA